MVININNLQGNTPQVKTERQEQRQQTAVQQNNTQPLNQHKQDSVSLTAQAQQFSKVQEKAQASDGIDQQKVEKIRQAIADGKYRINVEQLAKQIVQFEGELFDHR